MSLDLPLNCGWIITFDTQWKDPLYNFLEVPARICTSVGAIDKLKQTSLKITIIIKKSA